MSFLLDTDVCSAHLKRPAGLMHRFVQHSGGLAISTVALGELYVWAYRRPNPTPALDRIRQDLLADVVVLPFDADCSECFGRVRGQSLLYGLSLSRIDLMIASVALVHDLTVVTHNTADFRRIPNLRIEDWLTD
jgi:tRNA(fMet)-specific endonuclease VapC